MSIQATTDFETGLGEEARIEHGDVYVTADIHFNVRITNTADERVPTVLHAKYPKGKFLRSVYLAGRIFYHKEGDDWLHWYQVPVEKVTWQHPRRTGDPGWILIDLVVGPKETVYLSTFPTWPHRDFLRWLRPVARDPRVTVSVMGRTAGGRDIHVVSITDPAGEAPTKERTLILGGVHGNEYTGQFAARGMVEWLLSDHPLVRKLLEHYVFDIVVQMSVDGNVNNNYHNEDDVDWHHDCGEAWADRPAAPEARAVVGWIKKHGLPAYYLELHGAWQGNPNWRPYPLHIGVVTACSDLMRLLWHRDYPVGRGVMGEGASGSISWNYRWCWPLANSGKGYRYPEREVTLYDLLPNEQGVPTWTLEVLPGCGPIGNLDYDFGYVKSGQAALEAFLQSIHMFRRGSEYLVNGLPVLDGSLLLDFEVQKGRERFSARLRPAETDAVLLSPHKKVFDRRSRCRSEKGEGDPGVTVDVRTVYADRTIPYVYACAKVSDIGMAGSRLSLVLRKAEYGTHRRVVIGKRDDGTVLGLWLRRGEKRGVGFFALPRGFRHERKDVEPVVYRKGRKPVELRISSARVRSYDQAYFGVINQPVILVPEADERRLAAVAELVANPCVLVAEPGTVIEAEDWSYRVAPVAGSLQLSVTNPLRRNRDLVLEIEQAGDPAVLEVLLPGARKWKRVADVRDWDVSVRGGAVVVYVPELKGRKSFTVRVMG